MQANESNGVLNKTCQECRRRKTRCIALSDQVSDVHHRQCERCYKHGLDCIFLPPALRKRRVRNENRIKELERKIQEIQGAVKDGRVKRPQDKKQSLCATGVWANDYSSSAESKVEDPVIDHRPPQVVSKRSNTAATDMFPNTKALVDDHLAQTLFTKFNSEVAPLYPLVLPPMNMSWQAIRDTRPLTFQAMLTAASTTTSSSLCTKLCQDIEQSLASKVIIVGEKSLDIIQALLLVATWHPPPRRFQDLKFSQYVHMAATMVGDLRAFNESQYHIPQPADTPRPSETLLEICRTFMACYFLCSR